MHLVFLLLELSLLLRCTAGNAIGSVGDVIGNVGALGTRLCSWERLGTPGARSGTSGAVGNAWNCDWGTRLYARLGTRSGNAVRTGSTLGTPLGAILSQLSSRLLSLSVFF